MSRTEIYECDLCGEVGKKHAFRSKIHVKHPTKKTKVGNKKVMFTLTGTKNSGYCCDVDFCTKCMGRLSRAVDNVVHGVLKEDANV